MPWTQEEWDYCKECFKNSHNFKDAVKLIQEKYPNRTSKAISLKLHREDARFSDFVKPITNKDIEFQVAYNDLITYPTLADVGSKFGITERTVQRKAAKLKKQVKLADRSSAISLDLPLEERAHTRSLKDHISALRSELREAEKKILTANKLKDLIYECNSYKYGGYPDWLTPKKPSQTTSGIPTLFLSDLHFDEYVDPAQINFSNEFNREIAVKRLQHTFQSSIDILFNQMKNPKYDAEVIALGGDLLSGNIHDELSETNENSILMSLLDLSDILIDGIELHLKYFKKIFVPCVVGNHGRLHKKPRAKNAVFDNFEWLIYQYIAKYFKNNKNVSFYIPDGPDAQFSVYDKTFLLTHGNQFRGGSGISGIFTPLMLGFHKKQKKQSAISKSFDVMMLGHFHQYIHTNSLVINGCFTPDAPISISDGTCVPISSIEIGTEVITRTGIHKVNHVFEKPYDGPLVCFRSGSEFSDIKCTPNHEIYAIKGYQVDGKRPSKGKSQVNGECAPVPQWVPASMLSVGDYIQVAELQNHSAQESELTKDTLWMLGMYAAEGSISGVSGKLHHVDFTHHIKEVDFADRVQSTLIDLFGKARQSERPHKTTRSVVINSTEVSKWFYNLCGKGCEFKKFNPTLMNIEPDLQMEILMGWLLGDGHISKISYRGGRYISGTSVSLDLILQLKQIALRNGMCPSLYRVKPGKNGKRKRTAYTLGFTARDAMKMAEFLKIKHYYPSERDVQFKHIVHDNRKYVRITHMWQENYSGLVYDLEVDTDHSYSVNGITVHNSVKGYDEYAYNNNFSYEPPQQALWINHPEHGMIFRTPILCDSYNEAKTTKSEKIMIYK